MLLPDHGKHPQHQLKLYSVHSLADGIRIILPVTFPFVKPFEFAIVYDGNLGGVQAVVLLAWLDGIVLDDGRLQHRVFVALLVKEVLQAVRVEARVLHAVCARRSVHVVLPEPSEQPAVALLVVSHLGMGIPLQVAVFNENVHVDTCETLVNY